ncbi:MAG: hypothetical protein IAE63_00445 [Alphaproteobacteria bacterium]|nr:hypothetical protein [Alphaproteobacteria bacterium]
MTCTEQYLDTLSQFFFVRVQSAVDENYRRDPADGKPSGGFLLKFISPSCRPYDKQLVFEADNGIPYGLKCEEPNFLCKLFGAKAKVRVSADSPNILTLGTDFSNSRKYTLWSDKDEAIQKLAKRIAINLEMQHRVRTILGL